MFALVVLFFCAIAAPISWKKVQFQDSLVWCGWEINFSHDTTQLMSAKLAKLDALIKSLLGNRRVPCKTLEQCIGLPGLWITAGSNILEISGRALHCPQDIQRVPGTSKPTWVRIADPNNPYTSLSKSSQQCLTWLALAGANACAEDDMVGIGGWAITSSQVVETWNMQDIRAVWPCLVKPAQRYIARCETLAQLALLQATHSHIGGSATRLACLPAQIIPPRKQALTNCSRPHGRCNSLCN